MLRSFKYFLPAMVVAGTIFYFSSLPGSEVPMMGVKYEDLVLHFLAYSLLGFTLGIAFLHEQQRFLRRRMAVAIIVGILYGISDEFHQSFVPGRESTLPDVIADALGAMAGVYVYVIKPGFLRSWLGDDL